MCFAIVARELNTKVSGYLCVRCRVTVTLGEANDVVENIFLSLRAWEHKFETVAER